MNTFDLSDSAPVACMATNQWTPAYINNPTSIGTITSAYGCRVITLDSSRCCQWNNLYTVELLISERIYGSAYNFAPKKKPSLTPRSASLFFNFLLVSDIFFPSLRCLHSHLPPLSLRIIWPWDRVHFAGSIHFFQEVNLELFVCLNLNCI